MKTNKNILMGLILTASAFSTAAFAHEECAATQKSLPVCKITAECLTGGIMYYSLTAQDEQINLINVDSGYACDSSNYDGEIDKKKANKAVVKLTSQAQDLIAAGLCKVIVNDIE